MALSYIFVNVHKDAAVCLHWGFMSHVPVQACGLWLKSALRPCRLGSIDPRPSFSTRTNLWPVGYKATWQDDNVGSFQSEVMRGDDKGPLFSVTINPAGKGEMARVSSMQSTACTVAECSPDMSSGNPA